MIDKNIVRINKIFVYTIVKKSRVKQLHQKQGVSENP